MLGILATVEAAWKLGVDVAPYLLKLAATFKADAPPPTEADLDAMRALEASMSAEIQAPLPPEAA